MSMIGEQTRYVELRYDGDCTISGTAMRYGDMATLFDSPYGAVREKFEPGAFGNVSTLDVIMDVQHQRDAEIARTGGAGLELTDSYRELTLRAELDVNDVDSARALSKVKKGILRGLSVTFKPDKFRTERDGKNEVIVHERAILRGVGVVDRPAYTQAQLREQVRGMLDMDDEQTRKLVEELLEKRAKEDPKPEPAPVGVSADAMTRAIHDALEAERATMSETVATAVATALADRDAAVAAAAEQAKAEEQARAEAERMGKMNGKKKRKDGDGMEGEGEGDMEDEEDPDDRAETIIAFKALLPADFETRGASIHDILVAAAGDEIENAEERSSEYLMAKLEDVVERREEANKANAAQQRANADGQRRKEGGALSSPVSVHSVTMSRLNTRRQAVNEGA